MSEKSKIVVIGAGVAGLTTALLLSKRGHSVAVVAKHMPGDYDVEYTSPWAGANYLPVSSPNTREATWDRITFQELHRLTAQVPESGIHFQDAVIYRREKDAKSVTADWFKELLNEKPWFADLVPEFRTIPKSELPDGVDFGNRWRSMCVNTAIYLPYLLSQCLKRGVSFRRGTLEHIREAVNLHQNSTADIVVNCTGLGSRSLAGVTDQNLIPARGQIVLVRNTAPFMICVSGTDDGDDEAMYMMTRAAGGGTVLGGTYQKGDWNGVPDMATAERIMKRAVQWCPELVKEGEGVEGLDVIRHGVGLRPLRIGGARVEREVIGGVRVVHNYGAGGFGYQASYGMAEEAVSLVEESLGGGG
ncbi:FAD dependent oxidoreductase [Choiromyces venosus 120613-1]|uniref:D-amino-acid oxidase n=1 Tax=Choiromyces venosus 120613-1 TaxID=1336337 RepID=A0A3N4JX64_9PEZI|nr:FAD dependent oxidoreductase [Choiromyces venosus 120613-1]